MNILSNWSLPTNFATQQSNIAPIILITFGVLFLIIGIALFCLFPKAKRNANIYKQKQLDLYKEKNRRYNVQYEDTGMYLPPWEKVKVFLPLFLGLVSIIISVSLITKAIF